MLDAPTFVRTGSSFWDSQNKVPAPPIVAAKAQALWLFQERYAKLGKALNTTDHQTANPADYSSK